MCTCRYFLFGEDVNYSWWRYDDPKFKVVIPELGPDGRLYINGKPLVCVHHHFFAPDRPKFHRMMRYALLRSPAHARMLKLIDYVEYDFDLNLLYDHNMAASVLPVHGPSGDIVCIRVPTLVLFVSVLYVLYIMCYRRPLGGLLSRMYRHQKQ